MQKLIELCASQDGEMNLARLKSRLDRSGLELIVEKFETEESLIELPILRSITAKGIYSAKPTQQKWLTANTLPDSPPPERT